jgi:hypothetical protein
MIYLKSDDEATFTTALKTAGWAWDTEYRVEVDEETGEETVTEDVVREAGIEEYSATHSLDIIGVIHAETGETITVEATDDTEEHTYPETAPIDGWHANLLLHGEELPDALSGFVIEEPTAPVRRFA